MADLGAAGGGEDYYCYVEAAWAVVYSVSGEEVAGGFDESFAFGAVDGGFGGGEVFAGASADFDEDEAVVGVDHYKVYLACGAGVVAGEGLQALVAEEFLAVFLAPAAEAGAVGQEFSPGKWANPILQPG